MAIPIPPINLEGAFLITAPYSVKDNEVLICKGNMTFDALIVNGIDVLQKYYLDKGLPKDKYETDKEAGAVITTLYSKTSGTLALPSSYIASFPTKAVVRVNRFVTAATFTAPDSIGVDIIESDIKGVLEERLGIVVDVSSYVSPTSGIMTVDDYATFEKNRQASIKNRDTVMAENLRLKQQVDELTKTNLAMYKLLNP